MKFIAVSGGIGSGKTVVCRVLQCMGYKVYDCDSRAREIMDTDRSIKHEVSVRISEKAVDKAGRLDRGEIAAVVFNDPEKLAALNSIVHGAVRQDIRQWVDMHRDEPLLFVETAILYQSGIDMMVDEVWQVEAPEDVRIRRVCRRNGLSAEQVKARIESQAYQPDSRHPAERCIINDGEHSLLLQIASLLAC